jgi:glycine dehydrogenase
VTTRFPFGHFANRHIGFSPADQAEMLAGLGAESIDALLEKIVPEAIRLARPLNLPAARTEEKALADLREILSSNRVLRSHLGMGYSDCHVPPVVQRNILENPGWYTAYTPYQAEISQGRLEALLNFQTMVADLTGMDLSNASLLDEATAAAEAMALCAATKPGRRFLVSRDCHPQTIALLKTRGEPIGLSVEVVDLAVADLSKACGAILQNPATCGRVLDIRPLIEKIHAANALAVVAVDILSLALLTPPGECGADLVVGSTQRFGVPMGYGGPHAAFLASRDEFKRRLPGRLVGVSKDAEGRNALRLTLQTREQHIRREKATSNICTAQVLLAVMASMYAVYHGPEGIRAIASRVHNLARRLAAGIRKLGWTVQAGPFFDTVTVDLGDTAAVDLVRLAEGLGCNIRELSTHQVSISVDETTSDLNSLLQVFHHGEPLPFDPEALQADPGDEWSAPLLREGEILKHPVFRRYHTEHELLRYIRRLESKDLSLTTSMIPLGSCTMKLNATSEMFPVTWDVTSKLHPFAPVSQAEGYQRMFAQLEAWLAEITGFAGVSLQPNAGSQGEYAGLLVIRAYHHSRGDSARDICLIPTSAHGTNPASAVMAGFRVVAVKCDDEGNVDLGDLKAKIEEHREQIGALMVTYPSTHGVFEETIAEICQMVHAAGGQVYLDGANMNAQVGLCRPGDFGADVCHLNLHKTFCIPHGGGGPGVGPIGVASHLVPFLPGHPLIKTGGDHAVGAVSAAPWGSSSINVISWMYIAMMGPEGLKAATESAILGANYIAARLHDYFPVLFKGRNGLVAHECILDLRDWKARAGIEVADVAKRLMDFGFHAPTMSWPVAGTLMVEPTESESKEELDRFCEAMITIHGELTAIEEGRMDANDNPVRNSPHTATMIASSEWTHPYTREQAAFPAPWLLQHKFWPAVARIDNVLGDRHVVCTCPSVEDVAVAS